VLEKGWKVYEGLVEEGREYGEDLNDLMKEYWYEVVKKEGIHLETMECGGG
jgi:hypothetical protein